MDDGVKWGILTINGILISPIVAVLMIEFNKYPEWSFVLVILCFMLMIGATMVYA